jgi:hypothetical protein
MGHRFFQVPGSAGGDVGGREVQGFVVMRAQKHQPMIEELNTFLRGWIGYYRLVVC